MAAKQDQRRYHEFRQAVDALDLGTQYAFVVEIVLRDSDFEEADRALEDIRGSGSAEIVCVESLPLGDKRRL